jgi:hypothetical protein
VPLDTIVKSLTEILHRVEEIVWQIKRSGGILNPDEPISDVVGDITQKVRSLGIRSGIRFGVITDCVPHCRAYRVSPEAGDPSLICTRLSSTGGTPLGVSDCVTLQPNTHVFYIKHPTATYGLIIGVEPPFSTKARQNLPDFIVPGSNVGLHVDTAQREGFKLGGDKVNGGIWDWSAGSSVDSLEIGELNHCTETGLMLHMDSYMAMMRVDEMTGIFMYYWDQLCRVAGMNFQLWTGASTLESYDDEGEHMWYQGIATYPWEHRGMLQPGTNIAFDRSGGSTQTATPWYSVLEPTADDIQEFHRWQQYHGYLGQGSHKILSTPYAASGQTTPQVYSQDFEAPGLYEEVVTLSGHYGVRSATGLTIGKRPIIIVPNRKKLVQDSTGDNVADGYNSASQFPSGTNNHKVKPSPDVGNTNENLQRAAGAADFQAHLYNWEAGHPFHYHEKDFHYPEESESTPINRNQQSPDFYLLQAFQESHLNPPEPTDVKIDHRKDGTTKVYPNSSHVTWLDDGGVIIGDGYGSEIVMTGGNIRITCPGDISFEAGRNIIGWAGRDAVVRAKQSVDITATDNDVRLKAEKNMQLIAANGGGSNGLLLESRGVGTTQSFNECGQAASYTGVILKAKDGDIVNWSQRYFVNTFTGGNSIVLDADDGGGTISTRSATFDRYLRGQAHDLFVSGTSLKDGTVQAVNTYGEFATRLSGGIIANGNSLINGGGLTVEDNVNALKGSFGSGKPNSDKVGVIVGRNYAQTQAALQQESAFQQDAETAGQELHEQINEDYYEANAPGNPDVIERAEGSLRTDADYLGGDGEGGSSGTFILFEPRWSQLHRGAGLTPTAWTEKGVSCGGTLTYPFPGQKAMTSGQRYFTQDLNLVNGKTGAGVKRSDFETATYGTPKPDVLDGNYPIVG